MAYQQNTYDYYSQYPTTQASSYSTYSDPSQSYPSENAYSTTSSGQDVASYQGQVYAGTDTNSTDYTSTSSANQGSYPYQSYSYASSYDNANVAGQSNYTDTQTSAPGVTYGSYSDYSQSNTSSSSVAQPTDNTQSQYYTPSQNQSQGQYYAGYTSTTTTTTTETNQPSNVAQYTQYVPHDSGGYENINKPPDQTSYSYNKTNETNNAGPNFNSHLQTQDWSKPNQGQGTSLGQSSAYSNAAPQNAYVSTQPQANAEHQQTDQSYYYNYNQTSTSGDGYNQGAAQISSQSDAYKPTQTQDYGSQSIYGSRPGDGFTQPNRSYVRNDQRSANVNQTYQAPSHTDWNTGNIASNQPTVSQFSSQSGSSWNSKNNQSNSPGSRSVSQYSQKGREHRNQFGQKSQNTAGSANSKFSAKGGYSPGIPSTETRTVPGDSRRQVDFRDKREPWHSQEIQQRGNGSKLSNLRPIMPSSYPSGANSKAQPVTNTRPEQTHLKQKSFNSSTGNHTNKVGKGDIGSDNKNARTQNYSSQSTGNIGKNLPQKLNKTQIGQGVKQVSAGQDKMGPKGPGPSSPRGLGPISSARSGHRSKRGHDQSQPMQHDKVAPCGPGPFSPRFPAAMPPRGPRHMQQRGNNWMPPRGPDHMMLTGPGPRQAGPFNMAPRGPPVRPHRGPVPMPPRVPLSMPPRGPGGMHSPKVGPPPHKRQHSMEGGGKFDKWSRRDPSPSPVQMGRPPFGPMAPHDNRFRFRTPNEGEMFGPRFRGHPNESFPGGPRGLRPRMPFRNRPPVPWGRAPPGFPPRPRGPHWQDVPDLGPQSPPPMLGHPRKRRRSSGSPHRGEPRPLMAVRPTNVPRDGPTLFDPRGHQSQPFHPESFRDLQPPKLPNKMSIPQFLGTKSGTFGKYLTEIKRKLKIEQHKSEAKIDAKKSQDVKFLCDVCQVGFTTKEEESEHRNQHKQCDVEGCRFEGISKVLEIHKQQAHQPNIPAVKWSRDTDDVKAWLEERKRNFPTNANITAKKAVEEDKERVGAVLVTKEFGKMRGKKKKIVQTTEGGNEETKEDETTEENEVKEQEAEEGEKEAMATSDEEGTSNDKTDEKGDVEMENTEQKEVEKTKIEGAVEEKEEENMTVDEDLTESDDKEVATENISDDKQDITDLTESSDKEVATENKSGDQEDNADLTESDDKGVATENKSGDKEDITDLTESDDKEGATENKTGDKQDITVTKEVVFQRVKKEVVRRFKSGKGSKRDAWRNSRPIKKGVPAPGGRQSKVTLLEMLLAPEMRHERNLVLQCVRHTVNNDFFEPKEVAETKDVGSKNESIPPVTKETTASDEEQNVEIGTRAREEEEQDEGGKVDKGMSSSKLKDEDMNEADQIEDMACEEDGKVHQEEVEMRVLTDESVKDEANKSQMVGDGEGDASCSTGTIDLSVGVSDPKEKTLLIGEEKETSDLGDEEMMVDNHDDHDKERDAVSEKLQLGTDEDIDASSGKDKVAAKLMEDKFVVVEDMDDSEEVGMPAEQKMETSEGQQEWKITEEVAASVDDDEDDDDDQGGIGAGIEEGTQEGTTQGGSEMSTIEVIKEIGDPENVEADTYKQKVDVEEQFEVRDEDMIRADDKIRVQGDAKEEVAKGTENSEEDEAQKECLTSETGDDLTNKSDGSNMKAADEEEQAVVDEDTEIDETVKKDEQKSKEEDEGMPTGEVEVQLEEEEKGKQEETTEEIDKSQEQDVDSGVKPKRTSMRRSSRRKR
ncbi:uncharacterized protein [Apostichopus japonicus]|uniref:uncharacterized protein isoform X3 n=1 Tax=Stichopus japonicus TaxID=307972 RepID=UPI003AB31A56